MKSKTLRLTIDPEALPPSKVLAAMARSQALVVLTGRALGDLAAELGGMDQAVRHLQHVAIETGKPIGCNVATAPDQSETMFLAPPGWTSERLAGWVAGHHEEIEAHFGPATVRLP